MGRAIFKANVVGAARMAKQFGQAVPRIPKAVRNDFQNELGQDLEGIFRDHAPYDYDGRDNFHMQDTIEASMSGGGGIRLSVFVSAIDPESGYNYLDVTRFGHAGTIFPRHKRKLSWVQGGVRVVRPYSAGSHPGSDWVEDAAAMVDPPLDAAEERIGRQIERIIQ